MNPYFQWFDIKPAVKQRPRMTRRGRAYTPQATLEHEAAIREAYDGPLFDQPVQVSIGYDTFGFGVTIEPLGYDCVSLRGDIDNYVKATLDGLNGGAYDDDRLVRAVWAYAEEV